MFSQQQVIYLRELIVGNMMDTGNLASGMKREIVQKGISTIQVRLLTTMTMIGTSLHVQTLRSNTSYLMML